MREAFVPRFLLQEVAAEDHAQGGTVREIEEAQAGDRNVQLHRIDRDAKVAAYDTARDHGADHLDERRMHRFDLGRSLQVPSPLQVFGVEQRQEFRIADKIVPGEVDQAFDRLGGIKMFEIEATLFDADLLVGGFEHRQI